MSGDIWKSYLFSGYIEGSKLSKQWEIAEKGKLYFC